jgi:hypothetical protein
VFDVLVEVYGLKYEIDEDDYELFDSHKWRIDKDEYLFTNIKRDDGIWSTKRFHRLIMNANDSKIKIDHKDRDVRNNKKSNLRICTTRQNGHNRGSAKNSSSKYKGVHVMKNKLSITYRVTINIDGVNKNLGSYDNEDIAGCVYNIYAKQYYGEFANLNEVRDFIDNEIEDSRVTRSKSNKRRSMIS